MALGASAWGLAKEFLALFGCLCLVFNVLLPAATLALQFAAYDAPELLGKWKARRAQQHELARLERKIELLQKRLQRVTVDSGEAIDKQPGKSESDAAAQSQPRRIKPAAMQGDPLSARARGAASQKESKPVVRRRQQQADSRRARSTTRKPPAKASTAEETPKPVKQQHRHRLSIYSTAKKPPRAQDRAAPNARG